MIDEVYSVLQTITAKEHDGFVSPTEFNDVAKQVQEEIFRGYLEDINRDQNRANRGFTNPGYANLVENQTQKLEPFMVTSSPIAQAGGVYPLPADVYLIDENGITESNGRVVEKVDNHKRAYLSTSSAAPSDLFPVHYINGTDVTILPATVTGSITITYLKKPSDPVWAYTVASGEPVYNEANSTDFELHASEFPNIVVRMLSYFGINLREGEVIQVAESLKQQRDVKEES